MGRARMPVVSRALPTQLFDSAAATGRKRLGGRSARGPARKRARG